MANIISRNGEEKSVPLRSDRFFAVNHDWFFTTREGVDIGPFATKQDAYNGLIDFIDFVERADPTLLDQFLNNMKQHK